MQPGILRYRPSGPSSKTTHSGKFNPIPQRHRDPIALLHSQLPQAQGKGIAPSIELGVRETLFLVPGDDPSRGLEDGSEGKHATGWEAMRDVESSVAYRLGTTEHASRKQEM